MGKTGKKTKSDRINALRKQYDAFLDEDKKRKDRNEFILGRLEKMRILTPAVLPDRHNLGSPQISKYHFVTQERPENLRKLRFDDNSILHSRATDVFPDYVLKDEHKILQEISKKYILIPKLRPNEKSVTYYNPSSVGNDADWRNKYSILDELKKIEKEGTSDISKDTDIAYDTFNNRQNNDIESRTAAPENVREQTLDINRDPIYNIQQNTEKVPGTELQSYDIKTDKPDNIECKTTLDNEQNIIPNTEKNIDFENKIVLPRLGSMDLKGFSDSNKVNDETYSSENVVKATPRNENKSLDKSSSNQAQDVQKKGMKVINDNVPTNAQISVVKFDSVKNIKNKAVTQNDTVELCNPEIDDSNVKVQLIEKEIIDPSFKIDKLVAHPVESIENLEPCASVGQSEPVSEHMKQQDYEPNDETTNVSENIIPSQIDEFEAEQKEMFYSEETGYNQNVDTMGYNEQNEIYANEQYPYYNESQEEQPYYAEINEHEEATERYDPNYEQQYGDNYEENVNVAYDNHQYVGDSYENQQEVTNINYEQQPDQQELINVNYEQQPGQQDLSNINYEQQPLNYGYGQSPHLDNAHQSQIENINTCDGQSNELVNYETQQYNEVDEVEHPIIPDQNLYESEQDCVQMKTEQETTQRLEEQLDEEEGYIETQNTPSEHVTAAVEDSSEIEPNIRAT